jgi:hypothetical protein
MTGYWAVYQHTIADADGIQEAGFLFLYYDLTQTGTAIKVNHGLHCGIKVGVPTTGINSLGDAVTFPSAGPALLARQDEGQTYGSQGPRAGSMKPSGSSCVFQWNKYYTVRGATVSVYVDPSKTMSVNLPVASGCGSNWANCTTPGSEDWDNDNFAGVTLQVSGSVASGQIYAAQRDFNEFNGTVPMNATKFEVGAVDTSGKIGVGPEQYALEPMPASSSCGSLCTMSSSPDACPSQGCAAEYFGDWVRLPSPPGNDNTAICNSVVSMAATAAPRAMDPNPVPTEAKYQ